MKKIFIIIVIIHYSLFTIHYLSAQIIEGALIGGINISQVDGDQNYGFHKFGINAGASAIIPLRHRLSIALEILYSQKGSYQSAIDPYADSTGKYKLRLNYAEVPVLFQYNDKGGFTFYGGFSYGRLVYVAEEQYVRGKGLIWDNVHLNDGTYKNNDWEVIGGLKVKIYKGFYLDGRYSYSMIEIRKRYFYNPYNQYRLQYNNLLTFRIMWVINEQKLEDRFDKLKQETIIK